MKYLHSGSEIIEMLKADQIYNANGIIKMTLNNITVIVKQNDTVGNILQEWLGEFLRSKDVYFRPPAGQTFPDFYLSTDDDKHLCEMKSFVHGNSPAFDIANFDSYIKSLRSHAYRLDSDYLVFAYTSDNQGVIKINNMWCKKIWEISGPSKDFPLKNQIKQGKIYNIRPVTWMSKDSRAIQPFGSIESFLAALYKSYLHNTNSGREAKEWLSEVSQSYKKHSGVNIKQAVEALIAI